MTQKTAKKTHWLRTTLLVLIVCGIAGVILAAVQFNANPDRTYAAANLQFSFNKAGEGLGPNGYPFDTSGLFEEEVITTALKNAALEEKYTPEQIRENLTVTGVYPENIVRQMTAYNSLLDASSDQQAALSDYHPTLFSVKLFHDFDPSIPSGQLQGILRNLLDAYRVWFAANCAPDMMAEDLIPDFETYDYSQQLTALTEASARQRRYVEEMAELAPDFRQEDKGFTDMLTRYDTLDIEIDRLNASVTLNALSRDRERLRKQYEMEIRTLTRQMEGEQEEITQLDGILTDYSKDDIIYVSTSSALQSVNNNTSETYDKLVNRKKELTDAVAADKADIARYQALLADMAATDGETSAAADAKQSETAGEEAADAAAETPGTEAAAPETAAADAAETAAAETEAAEAAADDVSAAAELTEAELNQLNKTTEDQLAELRALKDTISKEFTDMLKAYTAQEINERTVSVSNQTYRTPSYMSGAFIVKAIKTAGPFCTLGLMACLVLLIRSRMKEEKTAKA